MEVWEWPRVEEDSKVSELDFLARGDDMQEARMTQEKQNDVDDGFHLETFNMSVL